MNITDVRITDAESLVAGGPSQVVWYSDFAQYLEEPADRARHDELVSDALAALRKVAPWFEPFLAATKLPVRIGSGFFAVAMPGDDGRPVIATINPICAEMQRVAGFDPTKPQAGTLVQ